MSGARRAASSKTYTVMLGMYNAAGAEIVRLNGLLAKERERCAEIAESMHDKTYWDDPSAGIAAKIRSGE